MISSHVRQWIVFSRIQRMTRENKIEICLNVFEC